LQLNKRQVIIHGLHLASSPGALRQPAGTIQIMRFKLFRKASSSPPRFEQDSALTEALARRVGAIEFQPSKGFLKDQQQPKRSNPQQTWARK
jgi:hypothetical protein